MIESFTAVNYLGESYEFSLTNPWASGFMITDIQGTGPVKGTINSSKVASVPGTMYNSATIGGRNIVIDMNLLPLPTVEDTRLKSYRIFPVLQPIKLILKTKNRLVSVTGHVESNEPSVFNREPNTKISIICDEAYFLDTSEHGVNTTLFYSVDPMFEYPWSNESLTENLIEFGNIVTEKEKDIAYRGDVAAGITITMDISGEVGDLVIYNPVRNEAMHISAAKIREMTGYSLTVGDRVVISTTRAQKSVTLFREGQPKNIMNALNLAISTWLQFYPGNNQLAYSSSLGVDNIQMAVESKIFYEGI